MTFTIRNVLGAAALFASAANAHVNMVLPVPYGKPDTSPLSASGANYPCKTDNGFKINSVTTMAVGTDQDLTFAGTAVHNGGSCQLSLTKGYAPTADSAFKVIMSIEGGCPGTDGTTKKYTFQIPAAVPDGEYSFAWTWFNNIGNREMYMNCAPIKVTGGAKDDSGFNALPDMAIYNIASKNTCKTVETHDVKFPIPGQKVATVGSNFAEPNGCGGSGTPVPGGSSSGTGTGTGTGTSGTGSGTGTSSANTGQYTGIGAGAGNNNPPTASSAPAAASPAASAPSVAAPAPAPAASGSGTFAEGSSNGTTGSAPSASPAAPAPAVPAPAPGSGVIGNQPAAACGPDGSLVCSSDGTQFGLCNWGKVMYQAVAAGTKCSGGQIMRRHNFQA